MTTRGTVVIALGSTQTIAWASSYYMPAVLGAPIAAALAVPTSVFFGLFSAALLLSAAIGPWVGKLIDRHGGRPVLTLSNLVIAAGLALLATAHGLIGLVVAWAVLGVGLGMGLYDPAFATLTWLYGSGARSAITGITLIAGFASTVSWPLSALFLHIFGWRAACLIWAAANLVLAAPANWLSIPAHGAPAAAPQETAAPAAPVEPPAGAMVILAFFFSATWFVQGAMAAHLPRLLEAAGASTGAAIAAASLVGPAQVGSRLVEFGLLRSIHPVSSARLASVLHPIGAALLATLGAPAIIAFALLHGAGNGMITIAKGTLPLALFGPQSYGLRSGLLSAPARLLQSTAPFLFGLLLDRAGTQAVWLTAGLCLAAFASLFLLRPRDGGSRAASPKRRAPDHDSRRLRRR